jgi:hypothetical protein
MCVMARHPPSGTFHSRRDRKRGEKNMATFAETLRENRIARRGTLFLATGVAAMGLALAGRVEQATVEQTGDEGQANTPLVAKAGDVFSLQASVAGVKGGKNGHDGDGDGAGDGEGGGNHGLGD